MHFFLCFFLLPFSFANCKHAGTNPVWHLSHQICTGTRWHVDIESGTLWQPTGSRITDTESEEPVHSDRKCINEQRDKFNQFFKQIVKWGMIGQHNTTNHRNQCSESLSSPLTYWLCLPLQRGLSSSAQTSLADSREVRQLKRGISITPAYGRGVVSCKYPMCSGWVLLTELHRSQGNSCPCPKIYIACACAFNSCLFSGSSCCFILLFTYGLTGCFLRMFWRQIECSPCLVAFVFLSPNMLIWKMVHGCF